MRKILILILLAVIAGGYFGYPFFTVKRLINAIHSRDTVAIDAMIDFKTVRENMRTEIMRQIAAKGGNFDSSSNAAAAGSMLGLALSGPVVDRMLESYVNSQSLVDAVEKSSDAIDLTQFVHGSHFVSPTVFEFEMQNPKSPSRIVPIVMEFQGAQWRVSRVVLERVLSDPKSTFESIVKR